MVKNSSTKTTVKKSTSPKQRVQDSKKCVSKKRGGGSLDPGPNKPKK